MSSVVTIAASSMKELIQFAQGVYVKTSISPTAEYTKFEAKKQGGSAFLVCSIAAPAASGKFAAPIISGTDIDKFCIVMEFSKIASYINTLKDEAEIKMNIMSDGNLKITGQGEYDFVTSRIPLNITLPDKSEMQISGKMSTQTLVNMISRAKSFTSEEKESSYWVNALRLWYDARNEEVVVSMPSAKVGCEFRNPVKKTDMPGKLDVSLRTQMIAKINPKVDDITIGQDAAGERFSIQMVNSSSGVRGQIVMQTDNTMRTASADREKEINGLLKKDYPYNFEVDPKNMLELITRFKLYESRTMHAEIKDDKVNFSISEANILKGNEDVECDHIGEFSLDMPIPVVHKSVKLFPEDAPIRFDVDEDALCAKVQGGKDNLNWTVLFSAQVMESNIAEEEEVKAEVPELEPELVDA